MSGKFSIHRFGLTPVLVLTVGIVSLFLFSLHLRAEQAKVAVEKEIINISNLGKKIAEFSIKRNIFSPDTMTPQIIEKNPPPVIPQARKEDLREDGRENVSPERNVEAETRRTVIFQGYVIRNSNRSALLSVNGEYIIVGVGDKVLGNIKITKIEKKTISVEADAKVFEIQLKGDNENE